MNSNFSDKDSLFAEANASSLDGPTINLSKVNLSSKGHSSLLLALNEYGAQHDQTLGQNNDSQMEDLPSDSQTDPTPDNSKEEVAEQSEENTKTFSDDDIPF